MQIKNHWITDAERVPTTKYSRGRTITPKFIVMHYTAGMTHASDLYTLAKSNGQVSCQLLIDRDGGLIQMGGFNRRMWHAGPSRAHGYSDLNSHSVGIEICNIGFLKKVGDDQWKHWNGSIFSSNDRPGEAKTPIFGWEQGPYPAAGSGTYAWEPYYNEQLETLDKVCVALRDQYPSIKWVVSHEEIDTRGWKTDPGPAFPMRRYERIVESREDPSVEQDDDEVSIYWNSIIDLHVRERPSWESDKKYVLKPDMDVYVLESRGYWLLISHPATGVGGWVYAPYMERQE